MRALVTGCAGFIGSHLTELLLEEGHSVVGIDCFNDNYGRAQKLRNLRHVGDWEEFEFVPVDLSRGDLAELTADADVVYHLAAEPGVRSSWGARYLNYVNNNVIATQQLEAPTHPLSPYGQTKLAAEHLCSLYRANFGVDAVSLRYFTVFGPRQRPDMAFHIFCRAALENRPIRVFGDGRQSRDFTFVKDVVAATHAAGTAKLGEDRIFNVGGGSPASIREVLDLIGDVSGRRLEVHYLEKERGDVRDTEANTTRVREQLGFAPTTTVEQGIVAEFQWVAETFSSGSTGA
jgi:UDP-glucuronate 4-epimerase